MYLSVLFFAAAANDSNENARGRKPTKQEKSPPMKRQKTETMSLTSKEPIDVFTRAQPFSFFLTKVHGISSEYNGAYTMSLRGIYRHANRIKICICLKYTKCTFMKCISMNFQLESFL